MGKSDKASFLELIHIVYDVQPTEREWLKAIADAAGGSLEVDLLQMAYTFEYHGNDYPLIREIGSAIEGVAGSIKELVRSLPPELVGRAFGRPMVCTASELFGMQALQGAVGTHLKKLGGRDPMGVVAVDTSGHGIVLTGMFRTITSLSPATRRRWGRMTAHFASGLRLRRAIACGGRDPHLPPIEDPTIEAVLDLGGKLHDATGVAETRENRLALRQAARAIDRAKSRGTDVDEALEAWRALVSGRWSLLEQFESDGRHYLVARPNPPKPHALKPLSAREQAAVALAAIGRANKVIAYELGISVGTVATLLQRAKKKLGVRSRAGLIAAYTTSKQHA